MPDEIARFVTLESRIVPLLINDVDTDQIIPADYLKTTRRAGLGVGLFAHWRQGPACALHRRDLRSAQVLLTGDNFGCGSSREHAPWALLDYGFRVVIGLGFADIFRINALRNGLLAVSLEPPDHERIKQEVKRDPLTEVIIDLERQRVALPGGWVASFAIEPFARRCLLEGIDQMGYLLSRRHEIDAYEAIHPLRIDTRRGEDVA